MSTARELDVGFHVSGPSAGVIAAGVIAAGVIAAGTIAAGASPDTTRLDEMVGILNERLSTFIDCAIFGATQACEAVCGLSV